MCSLWCHTCRLFVIVFSWQKIQNVACLLHILVINKYVPKNFVFVSFFSTLFAFEVMLFNSVFQFMSSELVLCFFPILLSFFFRKKILFTKTHWKTLNRNFWWFKIFSGYIYEHIINTKYKSISVYREKFIVKKL